MRLRLLPAVAAGILVLAWAGGARAGITLVLEPAVADFGSSVTFTGALTPARETGVKIFKQVTGGEQLVVRTRTAPDGTYAVSAVRWHPGVFVAAGGGDRSPSAELRIRPRLGAHLAGLPVLGAPLSVRGRVRPADAGTLRLTAAGETHTVGVGTDGRFSARLPTSRAGALDVTLVLAPRAGYVQVKRRLSTVIRTPVLSVGSHGEAVSFLEKRLHKLHYALRDVDPQFRRDTEDGVLAFQKVEGLTRDGVVGPETWKALRTARVPAAGVPSGRHIEVDKARQILFEVRRGSVRKIVQVSTGATGNTPVGRWRIYRKTPGYNSLGMYYSMYFLRGFAIHGYASVPPYPASHGCVREPLWFAPRIYSRWDIGSKVWVFPTTVRTSARWMSPEVVRKQPAPVAGGCGG